MTPKPKTLVEDLVGHELSADGKKLLVRKGDSFHVIASDVAAPVMSRPIGSRLVPLE